MSDQNSDNTTVEKKDGGPGFVLVFLIPLLVFFYASFKLHMSSFGEDGNYLPESDPQSKKSVLQLGFMVVVFLLVFGFVVKDMSKICEVGSKNFGLNSFLYSFIPFIFIFCTLMVALIMFPGWKAPFSNTIGYFIVKNVISRKLFNLQEWVQIPEGEDESLKALRTFNSKNTKTFFINELTPDNFFNALKSLNIGPGMQYPFHPQKKNIDGQEMPNPDSRGLNITKALYKAIVIKDMVSEFIWLLLGGVITYSVAQIYAIDHRCQSGGDKDNSAFEAINQAQNQAQNAADGVADDVVGDGEGGVLDDE